MPGSVELKIPRTIPEDGEYVFTPNRSPDIEAAPEQRITPRLATPEDGRIYRIFAWKYCCVQWTRALGKYIAFPLIGAGGVSLLIMGTYNQNVWMAIGGVLMIIVSLGCLYIDRLTSLPEPPTI